MISRRRTFFALGTALALAPAGAFAQSLKAFRLKLGDKTIDIDPDDPAEITLPDGSKTTATLSRNPFVTFAGSNFSFVHASELTVAKTQLGDGVTQHMIASAVGTIVIVQQYARVDPSGLQQTMVNELTKETKAAGGQVTQENAVRTIKSGQPLRGLRAIEKSIGGTADIEVLALSGTRPGILIVSRMDRDNAKQDAHILEKFWETFEIK